MRARRRWTGLGVALVVALAACNAITGSHDRFLEEAQPEDAGKVPKDRNVADGDDDDVQPGVDAGGDATIVTTVPINAQAQWSSPNKATAAYDGGTVIASFNPPHDNHPMLVPFPLPDAAGDRYSVRGRIYAGERSEYGLFVRGHNVANGFGVFVLSSRYGKAEPVNEPFLAPLVTARKDQTNDDPPNAGASNGDAYAFEPGRVWIFQLDVDGETIRGKIAREDLPSIKSEMSIIDSTPAADRGRSFGFYGFATPNAALLELSLTTYAK
ncbi:MAG: hypothetical protein U0270_44460 [Labilithrix sp.]